MGSTGHNPLCIGVMLVEIRVWLPDSISFAGYELGDKDFVDAS